MKFDVHITDTGETVTQEFDRLPNPDETWAIFVNDDLGKYKVLTVSGSYHENGVVKPALVTVKRIE